MMPRSENSSAYFSKTLFWMLAALPFVFVILKFARWETYGIFDFHTFHLAGVLANNGQAQLVFDWDTFVARFAPTYGTPGALPWFYPPLLLPYSQALALFKAPIAYVVFNFIGLAAYYLTVHSLFRDRFREIIILSAFPLLIPIAFGHPTVFFLVFLLLGYHLSKRNPVLALIALTVVATKPHVGGVILFLYFIKTLPKSLLPSIIIAAVAILSTSLVYGSDIWLQFLSLLKSASDNLLAMQLENPYRSSFFVAMAPFGVPVAIRWILHFALLAALCGLGAYAFRDTKADRFWVVAGLAAFFTSPYIVLYDYTLLLLPLILVIKNARTQEKCPWVVAVLFLESIPMVLTVLPPAYKFNFLAILLFTVTVLLIKIRCSTSADTRNP
jgi:hypothetical protein